MARKWIVFALVFILLISSAVLLSRYPIDTLGLPAALLPENPVPSGPEQAEAPESGEGKLRLTLSETGHFFDKAVEIAIIASIPDAEIYYTTDGSEPTRESKEYVNSLRFPVPQDVHAVTLKAVAVYGDTVTRPLAHTLFLGRNVFTRFDTLVFSLSTDPAHLYDYDTGILVEGRLRDEWKKKHPGAWPDPPEPANYNWRGMEGERPVYVEAFTPGGERVVAQAAGVRVSGGWSRANQQKSLRLIARKEYEPGVGKFHFDFFPDDTVCDEYGSPLDEYDQIVLRNGANDRNFGMLRHEAGCELARQAGLRAASPARAAAVFVNGEYYGFAWINVNVNEQYLQDIYGAPTKDFQIVGNGELWVDTDNTAEREAIDHLNSYSWKDLRNDKIFAEFEKLIDIDNLLLYYGFEILMGNHDWPHNNMKRWRYTGPQEEGLPPELDGRWRYYVYDLDWTLGLYEDRYPYSMFEDTLREGYSQYSPMLAALLKREDMARKFAMVLCDLTANVITEENVKAVTGSLYAEAANEIGAALAAHKYDHWVSGGSIKDNHANMVKVARGRGEYIYKCLQERFNFAPAMFTVNVTGGEAVIGTQKGTSSRYFSIQTVPLRPVLPKFTVFDHWEVNGKKLYEPDITVSSADAKGGTVTAALFTREELPPLAFAGVAASSERNGCVLVNLTDKPVRTEGLYISDRLENLFRWAIPGASVAPGGTLALAGKGSADPGDLLKIRMGFNVKTGEMLYLSDETGKVLDLILIP